MDRGCLLRFHALIRRHHHTALFAVLAGLVIFSGVLMLGAFTSVAYVYPIFGLELALGDRAVWKTEPLESLGGAGDMKRGEGKRYQLNHPNGLYPPNWRSEFPSWSQYGQDLYIDKLFSQSRGGFFVEIGGYDGEEFSNTLLLEKERGWDGLLVEANPYTYSILSSRDRKCNHINACVSNNFPSMTFLLSGPTTVAKETMTEAFEERVKHDIREYGGGGAATGNWVAAGKEVTIICRPFGALMKALGRTHIDYFSLDVEGAEMVILHSIPFSEITISVFTIEVDQNGKEIDDFMKDKGYKRYTQLSGDFVYIHKTQLP